MILITHSYMCRGTRQTNVIDNFLVIMSYSRYKRDTQSHTLNQGSQRDSFF